MKINAFLTKPGNFCPLLVNIDIGIVRMGFCRQLVGNTFVFTINKKLSAVAWITKDVPLSTDNEGEKDV